MKTSSPPVRDVILVGGGHAHVQVLKAFAMRPAPGVRLTLVSEGVITPYSGMLPGHVGGDYPAADIHIDLVRLCNFARARFILAPACGLDLDNKVLHLQQRPALGFDILSLNCGAQPAAPSADAVTVKPIASFLPKWQQGMENLSAGDSVAVVGAGAGGVELAMALNKNRPAGVSVHLIGPQLLPNHNRRARHIVQQELTRQSIEWVCDRVSGQQGDGVQLASGQHMKARRVFWVTGVQAADWIADTRLDTDARGFASVGPTLQSTSHDFVFAAGDIAHLVGQARPKSGVFAVRAGPVLSDNLRRYVLGRPLRRFRAQQQHLALLGFGDGRALASRGQWAASGAFWWRLKQAIDYRFMRKFNDLPQMPVADFELDATLRDALPQDTMRCGGCGAKLAAEPLRRVLARLPQASDPRVVLGIGDDAAQVRVASGSTLLSVDGFRSMIDDPYLFGRIATHHSLNDVLAMGAQPSAALALVTLPLMATHMIEEDLFQLLSGVTDVLAEHGASLVGGHSAEGLELSLGLTVMGDAPATAITKAGAQPGDQLLLTKPLGTGVVLAAAMQGKAASASMAAVLQGMDASNQQSLSILLKHGVSALTDVTGFGLAGHLGEMLRASQCGVLLHLDSVPFYPGAVELFAQVHSSLQPANELVLQDFTLLGQLRSDNARLRALADPQTAGGLLAALAPDAAELALNELKQAGIEAVRIGEISHNRWEIG